MLWELKLQQASLSAEIKAARRIERKLKKMRDRTKTVNIKTFATADLDAEVVRIEGISIHIPGTNPEGYKLWGNNQLLEIQKTRRWSSELARSYHLAHMFLKGVPYKAVEQTNKPGKQLSEEDWNAISAVAKDYAGYRKLSEDRPHRKYEFASAQDLAQRFEQWKQGF